MCAYFPKEISSFSSDSPWAYDKRHMKNYWNRCSLRSCWLIIYPIIQSVGHTHHWSDALIVIYLLDNLFFSGSLRGQFIGKAGSLYGKKLFTNSQDSLDACMHVLCLFLPFFSCFFLFSLFPYMQLHCLVWIKINIPD